MGPRSCRDADQSRRSRPCGASWVPAAGAVGPCPTRSRPC